MKSFSVLSIAVLTVLLTVSLALSTESAEKSADNGIEKEEKVAVVDFPQGTATPSEVCGACHVSIYREHAMGFGSDMNFKKMLPLTFKDKPLSNPPGVSSSITAHAFAGKDPYPIHARDVEEGGKSCNVCHFPVAFQLPDMESSEIPKVKARSKEEESGGLTCASGSVKITV